MRSFHSNFDMQVDMNKDMNKDVNRESRAFIKAMRTRKRRLDDQRLLRPPPPASPEVVRLKRLRRSVGLDGDVREISTYLLGHENGTLMDLELNCLSPLSGEKVHTPAGVGVYAHQRVLLFGREYDVDVVWRGRWVVDEIFDGDVPVGTIVLSGLSEGVVRSSSGGRYVVRLSSGCVSCKLKLVSRDSWSVSDAVPVLSPAPAPARNPLVYIAREMSKNGVDTQGSSR